MFVLGHQESDFQFSFYALSYDVATNYTKTLTGKRQDNWVAQWLSGRVLDSRPRGRVFKPHRRHCVVS